MSARVNSRHDARLAAPRIPCMSVLLAMGIGIASCSVAVADRLPSPPEQPEPDVRIPSDWAYLSEYSDEFPGDALDRSKWQTDVPSWGSWSWGPDAVQVRNGTLWLRMFRRQHRRDGESLYYVGGIVRSRAAGLRYGYVEARIKAAPRFPGVASAFWLFRNTPDYWTEIDIAELMQRRLSRSVVDFSMYVLRDGKSAQLPPRYKSDANVQWDPSADFHTYALMWTPESIIHLVDGVTISSQANRYWHREMDVVLSIGLRAPLDDWPSASGFPTAMIVDYVRCWGPPEPARQPEMKPPLP